jgi:hypothetical protein
MRIVFISLLTLLAAIQLAYAQTVNPSPSSAPEKTILLQPAPTATSEDAKKSETSSPDKNLDSVIKNPSSLVSPEKIKDAIGSVLMNNKATSLMFDDEENTNINRAIDSLRSNQPFVPDENLDDRKMSEEEKKLAAQKAEEEERKKLENEKSYAHLASILYLNDKNWVVWINQRKLLSSANKPTNELYIKSITKDQVSCVWRMSLSKWKILSGKFSSESAPKINSNNQVEMTFVLRPNQAYSLVNSRIVEGKSNIGDLASAPKLASGSAAEKDTSDKTLNSINAAKISSFTNSVDVPTSGAATNVPKN